VIWRARHLQDDRLYECYLAAQTGEAVDPPAAEHLADCQPCQERYAELTMVMSDLRADADAQVDEAFSAEALRAQQAHILRRIEHLGHAARVISFPKHQLNGSGHAESRLVAPRWLVAAAAAGLVVGVGVGTEVRSPLTHVAPQAAISAPAAQAVTQQSAPQPVAQPAAVDAGPASASVSEAAGPIDADDEFFLALGSALQRTETPELVAFEELTPHIREVRYTAANYR
jgi:hypothetical protein